MLVGVLTNRNQGVPRIDQSATARPVFASHNANKNNRQQGPAPPRARPRESTWIFQPVTASLRWLVPPGRPGASAGTPRVAKVTRGHGFKRAINANASQTTYPGRL